ncbi:uncharacterized protein LOC113505726, partial [Trichoplusia ni]|uniref:Uncharacterized protein LOC113505726 n=1 Tax=Trichoplusia ni TaxID=7111 RepID=A0A7E5WU23_TRINI
RFFIAATLQRKWKSLRDSFNREIGKQNKSGSGASGRKEYIYFKQLSFLKRLKNVRSTTDEEINENDSELKQPQELKKQEESCSLLYSSRSISSSRRRAMKRNIDKTENEILQQLSDNLKKKYERPEDVDPDKDFLMSVLPDIRKIHDDFKIDFKSEMLQLIKKYKMYEPIHNYRSYSSQSYGYSTQNTNAYTTNQATTSTAMSSPSALSNYSNHSTDDSSIIENLFDTES